MGDLQGRGDGEMRAIVSGVKARGKLLGGFIGLLWAIEIVNAVVFGGALFAFGVHPRSLFGLLGILFASFLHLNFAHLIANTVPLAVLGWFVMMRNKRDLVTVSVLAALVGGLGTWLIAPALSVHAGASVLVFGYLGYLLARGVFERRVWPILGAVAAFFLYGGALWGVLPTAIGVSWQGHLFGLIGGVLAARLMRTRRVEPAAAVAAVTPGQVRRRVAQGDAEGARLRLPSQGTDQEAEIEAELAQAKERLRARASR